MKKKICKFCNKTVSWGFDYSNLNFNTQKKRYCFSDRIIFPSIPKDTKTDMIVCAECASKLFPIKCKKHGQIKEKYFGGLAPVCQKCEQDEFIKKGKKIARIASEKIQTLKTDINQKTIQIKSKSQLDIKRFQNKVTSSLQTVYGKIANVENSNGPEEKANLNSAESKKNYSYQDVTSIEKKSENTSSKSELIVKELKPLSTNELYKRYNEVKKENLLIGLFSDLMLFNKELENDISLGELEKQLKQMDLNEFRRKKKLYTATLEKLLLFSETLPELKKNFVLMDTFYPHYQFASESEHLNTVFGEEFPKKLNESEEENIFNAFKQNINLLNYRFNKIFPEIERSLFVVDTIFAKQGIQKSLLTKIAKAAPAAGQTILVGTMVAIGGPAGVTVLAGMLGIRAMGDILNRFKSEEQDDYQLKNSAEKIFNWWGLFRNTLPATIYELNLQLNKENKRTTKRDHDIFLHLKKTNKISNDLFDERLRKQIITSIELREHEVLPGTGIGFNEISNDILTKLKESTKIGVTSNNRVLS